METAETPTFAQALEAYLTAANRARQFPIPMGKGVMPGSLDSSLSSDGNGTTLIISKPPNDFAHPEHFDPQLETLTHVLENCGISLEPIPEEEAPRKSRLRQFFTLAPEPDEKRNLVAFEVTAENETAAIAALTEKTVEMKQIALEKRAEDQQI